MMRTAGCMEGGKCMAQVHHFEYGWVTPVFAYTISVLGSLLGLTSTARARTATGSRRAWRLVLRGGLATITAAAGMGAAVCGMHYTGMAALRVHLHDDVHGTVPGVNVNVFLAPIVLFVVIVVIALSYVMMAMPSAEEQDRAA